MLVFETQFVTFNRVSNEKHFEMINNHAVEHTETHSNINEALKNP